MSLDTRGMAATVAGRMGVAGSGNLALWALCIVLVLMALTGGGSWWLRSRIARGEVATQQLVNSKAQLKTAEQDNKTLAAANAQAAEVIVTQQRVLVESTRRYEAAAAQLDKIAKETALERENQARQMAIIRGQLETALAARPDLRAVHVGGGVLDAWNAANRGRADTGNAPGAAGAGAGAAGAGRQPVGAVPAGTAGGGGR